MPPPPFLEARLVNPLLFPFLPLQACVHTRREACCTLGTASLTGSKRNTNELGYPPPPPRTPLPLCTSAGNMRTAAARRGSPDVDKAGPTHAPRPDKRRARNTQTL